MLEYIWDLEGVQYNLAISSIDKAASCSECETTFKWRHKTGKNQVPCTQGSADREITSTRVFTIGLVALPADLRSPSNLVCRRGNLSRLQRALHLRPRERHRSELPRKKPSLSIEYGHAFPFSPPLICTRFYFHCTLSTQDGRTIRYLFPWPLALVLIESTVDFITHC